MISDAAPSDAIVHATLVRVQPRRVALGIVLVSAVLVILHISSSLIQLSSTDQNETHRRVFRLLNMGAEISLSTWWTQSLLLAAAGLLLWITVLVRGSGNAGRWWGGLALILLLASIDEGASLHELAMSPMQDLFEVYSGPWAAGWVYPVGALVVAAAAVYLRFFIGLPAATRLAFAVALATFLVGAVGFEVLERGLTATPHADEREVLYATFVATEEFLEMTGAGILIVGLLRHLRDHVPRYRTAVVEIVEPQRRSR